MGPLIDPQSRVLPSVSHSQTTGQPTGQRTRGCIADYYDSLGTLGCWPCTRPDHSAPAPQFSCTGSRRWVQPLLLPRPWLISNVVIEKPDSAGELVSKLRMRRCGREDPGEGDATAGRIGYMGSR